MRMFSAVCATRFGGRALGVGTLSLSTLALVTLATLASLAACDEKKPDVAPAAKSAAPVVSSSPAKSAASAAPSAAPVASAAKQKSFAEKMSCEALLPEKARQGGLLNYKLTQQNTCAECGPTCSMVRPDKPFEGLAVAYVCNVPYDKGAADKVLAETKKAFAKPVTLTMGRGGVMGEKDNGTFYSAVVFDDDSDCRLNIDWMRGDKKMTEPVAKMALQNVKQSDVEAARK